MQSSGMQDAVVFATQIHFGQWRDGDQALPYITHPLEVCGLLHRIGQVRDEVLLISAILHDVLEENPDAEEKLVDQFGEQVGNIVRAMTRPEPSLKDLDGLTKKGVYQLRNEYLLESIRNADPICYPIRLADRLSNWREATIVRDSRSLSRYQKQTHSILKIIPKASNKWIWNQLAKESEF